MNRETGLAVVGFTASFAVYVSASSLLVLSSVQQAANDDAQHGVVAAIVGKSRLGLSSHFYRVADTYFHKGVEETRKIALENSFFLRISRELSPRKIAHVSGSEMQDMIPWLWLAVRLEPHNIEAYLVAAFIAGAELGRHDLAHQIIAEGRLNNPRNHGLWIEDGRIYLKDRNYPEAKRCFENALAFWPGEMKPDSEEAKDDKANIHFYRAIIAERMGDVPSAMTNMIQLLQLHPERTYLRERIEMLEKGTKPSDLATEKWNDMVRKNEEMKATCRTDHDHAGGHETDAGGDNEHKH